MTDNEAGPSTSPLASGPSDTQRGVITSPIEINGEHAAAEEEGVRDDFDDFDDFDSPGAGAAEAEDDDGFGDFGDFEEGDGANEMVEDAQPGPVAQPMHGRFVSLSESSPVPQRRTSNLSALSPGLASSELSMPHLVMR